MVTAKAQQISAVVVDSTTGNPLPYAGIIYAHGTAVTYADEKGVFYFTRDSINRNDSVIIEFLGFNDLHLPAHSIKNGMILKMIPSIALLNPLVISDCNRIKEVAINKNGGKIRQYIGPGPETKFIIISRFDNRKKRSGYIKNIALYTEASTSDIKMPVRIRWYEWNDSTGMPGKEKTNREILVTPMQAGWSNFEIPDSTIFCSSSWCVLGFEFIYPAAYLQKYQQIIADTAKIQWLNNLNNRWSLGTVLTRNRAERSFYIINNFPLQEYTKQPLKYYVKPAIGITIKACYK